MSESTAAARVRALVETVSEALALRGDVEIVEDGESIRATLQGDDVGLFIGRHGQTIDAVQHLAYKVASTAGTPAPRVIVDAAGYRERREEALHRQAEQAAARAARTGDRKSVV